MSKNSVWTPDPKLDLVLERIVDVPRELVWRAWTEPEYLKPWFCPVPWKVTECEIDLRPGGVFKTIMQGPEGQVSPNVGTYLEIVPNERLVWTDALQPGFRPSENPFMTGIIMFEPHGEGTRYIAMARHKDEAVRAQHEEMGFHEGWGIALDQLVAMVKAGL
jgi:uncharacterized protein YndB with AHSA1/START domain